MFTSNFVCFRVLVAEALVVSSHVLPVMREPRRRSSSAGTSPASSNPAPGSSSEPVSKAQPIEGRDEVAL